MNEPNSTPAHDVRGDLVSAIPDRASFSPIDPRSDEQIIADAIMSDPRLEVRRRASRLEQSLVIDTDSIGDPTDLDGNPFRLAEAPTDDARNEAPQPLLNEFYASGLRRAIQIIQGEDYPLSNGLARVSSMVSDIEDEIVMEEDVSLSEAEVVVRWLTAFSDRGIVTIGGKGGALEAARQARS